MESRSDKKVEAYHFLQFVRYFRDKSGKPKTDVQTAQLDLYRKSTGRVFKLALVFWQNS
jgi:hypothetical protein